MATYKMLSAQKGVLPGGVHPVAFEAGKTYEIDETLAAEFQTLDAIEPSSEEPVPPLADDAVSGTHENWLDTDPAVLRHGELTAQEVVARDESDNPLTTVPLPQVEGKAEGQMDTPSAPSGGAEAPAEAPATDADAKPKKSK